MSPADEEHKPQRRGPRPGTPRGPRSIDTVIGQINRVRIRLEQIAPLIGDHMLTPRSVVDMADVMVKLHDAVDLVERRCGARMRASLATWSEQDRAWMDKVLGHAPEKGRRDE